MIQYTIYIGGEGVVKCNLDPLTPLSAVRNTLEDKLHSNYRFLNYQNINGHYADIIVGITNETFLPVGSIAGIKNQVYLTDTATAPKTDFIGFRTSWFLNNLLGARIQLNSSSAAQQINCGKMAPLMLTNVKLANPKISGADSIENVIFCEEDSAVQFEINSWGAAGFGFDIYSQSGDPITDMPLYVPFSADDHRNRAIGILPWHAAKADPALDGNAIRIGTESSRRLPDGTIFSQKKIIIRSWNVRSYTKPDGTRFDCNLPAPKADPKALAGTSNLRTMLPSILSSNADISSSRFAGIIDDIQEDTGADGILGEVVFYVFAFKSKADAADVFKGVNAPDQALWVVR